MFSQGFKGRKYDGNYNFVFRVSTLPSKTTIAFFYLEIQNGLISSTKIYEKKKIKFSQYNDMTTIWFSVHSVI